jgi:chromosome segregation ATPase
MAEDTIDELRKELEGEREKIKRLEELLKREETEVSKKEGLVGELYRRIMVEGMASREDVAKAIGREQYDALTYHLSKEHEKRVEAEKKLAFDEEKLKAVEKKLAEDEESLQKDSRRILEIEEELAIERKKRIEFEKQLVRKYLKPRAGPTEKPVESVDLDDLESVVQQVRPPISDVNMGDLARLLIRLRRIKSVDAGIMLNTTKERVLRLAAPLANGRYIKIENPKSPDPTIRALKKLLEMKGQKK